MKPYYEDTKAGIVIYHGDCRAIMPELERFDLVLTDPPWGTKTKTNSQRFTRNTSPWWKNVDNSKVFAQLPIYGDDFWFDPQFMFDISDKLILWGANNYAQQLPNSNGWLIWDKRKGAETMAEKGWPLGEAELAWTNVIGATRVFRNLWSGLLRSEEKGDFFHPTQKPVGLMKWCLGLVSNVNTVIDPFMGSGSTLRASKDMGKNCVGIEIEELYCEIAANRLAQEVLDLRL